jgi:arylsulfatase
MKRIFPVRALPVVLLLAGAASGCTGGEAASDVRPLLDGLHAPDVLTEQREVALPPSLGGNRFLTGWWPWLPDGRDGALVLSAIAPKARIEIVNLGPGRRTLVLDLLPGVGSERRSVRVEAAGRDLGSFPLTDPLEVPLPEDLPLGRVPIDLAFDRGGSRGVLAAALRPARPAGEVRLQGGDIEQEGDSLVDLVHRVPAGATLKGSFAAPAEPRAGQRFELTVEREDGTVIGRFAWSGKPGGLLRGGERIALPLGDAGLVRVRLQASGRGPSGRWEGLAIVPGPASPVPVPAEPAGPAGTPPAPPRLVIVYVMDALRADAVGHLGGRPGVSPTLDRLAREGVTFTRHRSVAPNTIPSTKSLFTGRTFVSGGDWPLSRDDGETLAELFQEAGYRTGLFSGNVYVSAAYGTDRGFEHAPEEVLMDVDEATGPERFNEHAARAHASALAWLEALPPGERAFLYIHTIHPHNPYDPPEPFRSRYTRGIRSRIDGSTKTLSDVRKEQRRIGQTDRERLRGLYTGAFAYNDAELDRFLKRVKAWARPEETLVAVTSDHGEELFEHGGVLHGYTLYEEMMSIPLVLWAPGRLRPRTIDEPTDTLDLHATLLGLLSSLGQGGLPGHGASDGRVLPGVLALPAPPASPEEPYVHLAAASSVVGGIYSARSGPLKLVWAPRSGVFWGMGDGLGRSRDPEYLFDLEADPGERINRAGDGGLEAAWLRSRLLAWVQRNRGKEATEPDRPIDAETEGRLRALGYLNAESR